MGKWLIILSLFLGGTSVAETLEEEKSPFEFSLSYIVDTLANVSGGVQTGTEVLGSLLLELGIDAEEAVGWTGGSFHFGVLGALLLTWPTKAGFLFRWTKTLIGTLSDVS